MGPISGPQDPGGPHVGPMNFATWVGSCYDPIYHDPIQRDIIYIAPNKLSLWWHVYQIGFLGMVSNDNYFVGPSGTYVRQSTRPYLVEIIVHYLNQCYIIVMWAPNNQTQWNVNQNIPTNEIAEKCRLLKASGLFRPQCLQDSNSHSTWILRR